jgi:hypothetical protein
MSRYPKLCLKPPHRTPVRRSFFRSRNNFINALPRDEMI